VEFLQRTSTCKAIAKSRGTIANVGIAPLR
jgi:hypothetical protein